MRNSLILLVCAGADVNGRVLFVYLLRRIFVIVPARMDSLHSACSRKINVALAVILFFFRLRKQTRVLFFFSSIVDLFSQGRQKYPYIYILSHSNYIERFHIMEICKKKTAVKLINEYNDSEKELWYIAASKFVPIHAPAHPGAACRYRSASRESEIVSE